MALSNMEVFNKYVMPATIETLDQMYDQFNAASGGTIRLEGTGFEGDFSEESFYTTLAAAQRRVDRYASNGSASSTALAQTKTAGVKVAGGIGPIVYEPGQMTWLEKAEAEGIEVASRSFAEIIMKDQMNTAIACLVAATENNAAVVNDVSGTGGITYAAQNTAHSKFGDHSGDIRGTVMGGSVYHRLIGENLTNAERLFQSSGVLVIDILGKAVVVTDAPALYEAGTPNKDKVLGLVEGAATINGASDVITNIETNNGNLRIETTLQSDYSFGVNLKGYSWDVANGGKSPTDAELATGSNWDKVVTSDKHTAGVLTIGSADA